MDQPHGKFSKTRHCWGLVALALPIVACSGAQPRGPVPETAPDAAGLDPVKPTPRPDATRRGDEDAAGLPADSAAPSPSPDAARLAPDAAAVGPDAAPVGVDAARRPDVFSPDLAEPGDTGAPPAAPSACPALTAGWTAYVPGLSLQFEGGSSEGITSLSPESGMLSDAHCTYTRVGGVELFRMTKNPAGFRQRCEMRVKNEYRTGSQMFEGDVRVTAGSGTCVHQIFKFLMLVAYPQNGGELHQHSQTFLASGVFGKWVHVNTVHDTAAGKVDIYIDCVKKLTMPQGGPDTPAGWYHKYGVYNSGVPTAQSEWRDVRFYRK